MIAIVCDHQTKIKMNFSNSVLRTVVAASSIIFVSFSSGTAFAETLTERLKQKTYGVAPVTDKSSCLRRVEMQNKLRMEVQERGGIWGWFEQNSSIKKYSNRGMQMDSLTNKMVLALKRLCETAKGAPMNNHSRRIFNDIQNKGEETVRKELVGLGLAPADVEIWINFAHTSKKIEDRNIEYSELDALLARSETLTNFYSEFSQREINSGNVKISVDSSETFLGILKELLEKNANMSMALYEEEHVPYESPTEH